MSGPKSTNFDVLIAGAGAAGLAAAAELAAHGRSVCVLEARDRLGGRIFTRREPGLEAPVELGAEYIHGEHAATLHWLRGAHAGIVEVAGKRFRWRSGELRPAQDSFAQLKAGLSRIRRPRKDLPFAEFLDGASARRVLPPRVRQFARALVEGFDAADATRVSTLDTLEEWNGGSAADARTFRPLHGYAALVEALCEALAAGEASLRLNSIVQEIHWERGAVTLRGVRNGRPFEMSAPKAVVALPLGVLQSVAPSAGAVRFVPSPARRQAALAGLVSGPALRVVLRFGEPFWERLDAGRYRHAGFLLATGAEFPTFWTALPRRAPLLVAWAAGPNAQRLGGLGRDEIVGRALGCAQRLFGRRVKVEHLLECAYMHDWQADPFARGAYSYMLAGAASARRTLAAPLKNTLFFAGEATDLEGGSGTVGGALNSGRRAAREILGGS